MKQYLYKITPMRQGMVIEGPTKEEAGIIISKHFGYLKSLTEQGSVLLFGRTQNSGKETFGIAIFRADSEEQAKTIMKNDPAVQNGVMKAKLYEYKLAVLNARDWQAD